MEYYSPYTDGNPRRVPLDAVENFTLADFGLTPDAVKEQMFGLKVIDPSTGNEMGDDYYITALNSAVANAEKVLDVKILPRFESERKDFYIQDYNSYGFMKLNSRPVLQVEQFTMEAYNKTLLEYQSDWWRVSCLQGAIQLMPTLLGIIGNGGLYTNPSMMNAQSPWLGIPVLTQNSGYAPQMFQVNYICGMLPQQRDGIFREWEMHPDLKFLILKQATKSVLEVWGRLIIGAGIASKSFAMDGIEETIVTTQSAMYGGASADILQLDKDISELTIGLQNYYGINLGII